VHEIAEVDVELSDAFRVVKHFTDPLSVRFLVKLHKTQSQLSDFGVELDGLHHLFEVLKRVLEPDPLEV